MSNRELSLKVGGVASGTGNPGRQQSRPLPVAAAGFVVYETFSSGSSATGSVTTRTSAPCFGAGSLAAAGFFALGFFSRSWWSSLLLAAPLLVAFYFVYVVWTTNYPNGGSLTVNTNFPEIWLAYSAIFVPVWAAGC